MQRNTGRERKTFSSALIGKAEKYEANLGMKQIWEWSKSGNDAKPGMKQRREWSKDGNDAKLEMKQRLEWFNAAGLNKSWEWCKVGIEAKLGMNSMKQSLNETLLYLQLCFIPIFASFPALLHSYLCFIPIFSSFPAFASFPALLLTSQPFPSMLWVFQADGLTSAKLLSCSHIENKFNVYLIVLWIECYSWKGLLTFEKKHGFWLMAWG